MPFTMKDGKRWSGWGCELSVPFPPLQRCRDFLAGHWRVYRVEWSTNILHVYGYALLCGTNASATPRQYTVKLTLLGMAIFLHSSGQLPVSASGMTPPALQLLHLWVCRHLTCARPLLYSLHNSPDGGWVLLDEAIGRPPCFASATIADSTTLTLVCISGSLSPCSVQSFVSCVVPIHNSQGDVIWAFPVKQMVYRVELMHDHSQFPVMAAW